MKIVTEGFQVSTKSRNQMIDITSKVRSLIVQSGISNGDAIIYCSHTTAAITINENADPDVPRDILKELDKVVPLNDNYSHREGNSAAHIKASLVGASETILIEKGRLVLGTWQSVFFCEFDGPRTRKTYVTIV